MSSADGTSGGVVGLRDRSGGDWRVFLRWECERLCLRWRWIFKLGRGAGRVASVESHRWRLEFVAKNTILLAWDNLLMLRRSCGIILQEHVWLSD